MRNRSNRITGTFDMALNKFGDFVDKASIHAPEKFVEKRPINTPNRSAYTAKAS